MRREKLPERPDWRKRLEEAGCEYHTIEGARYWTEDAAYVLTVPEIDRIEDATRELHAMCMHLCESIVTSGDNPAEYSFPNEVRDLIEQSWKACRDKPGHLLGRFDLGYNGIDLKLFEYNADTPTSLPEASIWQWHALEDRSWPDQFNSIHEKLLARLQEIVPRDRMLHLVGQQEAPHEDWGNIHYLADVAAEAGFERIVSLAVEQVGWNGEIFTDLGENPIRTVFKLYPWEWLMADEFGWNVRRASAQWIEPPWKMLLSTKAILPLLWRRHPNHPLLLEAHHDTGSLPTAERWVRKPLLGREGANITLHEKDKETVGIVVNPAYDKHGYVLQRHMELPRFDGHTPILGSWVIGDEPAGLGIREDVSPVTSNASAFVPHYFVE